MKRIIAEIKKDIECGRYLSALTLALTIPDICRKALYPNTDRNTRKYYIKWYDENIGMDHRPKDISMPYLDGDMLYELRCSVLHSGSYTLNDVSKLKDQNKVTNFHLYVDKTNANGKRMLNGSSTISSDNKIVEIEVEIISLCYRLCRVAEIEYNENKEKFDKILFCTDIEIRD